MLTTIQLALSAVGGWLGWFLGDCDGFLLALVLFVIMDYLAGVMAAITDRSVSSKFCLRCILRKVLIFFLVGVAVLLDRILFQEGNVLRMMVIVFYLSSEGISLLEHAGELGLPIPKKLASVLNSLKENENGQASSPDNGEKTEPNCKK